LVVFCRPPFLLDFVPAFRILYAVVEDVLYLVFRLVIY